MTRLSHTCHMVYMFSSMLHLHTHATCRTHSSIHIFLFNLYYKAYIRSSSRLSPPHSPHTRIYINYDMLCVIIFRPLICSYLFFINLFPFIFVDFLLLSACTSFRCAAAVQLFIIVFFDQQALKSYSKSA